MLVDESQSRTIICKYSECGITYNDDGKDSGLKTQRCENSIVDVKLNGIQHRTDVVVLDDDESYSKT